MAFKPLSEFKDDTDVQFYVRFYSVMMSNYGVFSNTIEASGKNVEIEIDETDKFIRVRLSNDGDIKVSSNGSFKVIRKIVQIVGEEKINLSLLAGWLVGSYK